MGPIVVIMIVVVATAVLALAYAAFLHGGARVPGVPWLGAALERAADAVPTVGDGDLDRDPRRDARGDLEVVPDDEVARR